MNLGHRSDKLEVYLCTVQAPDSSDYLDMLKSVVGMGENANPDQTTSIAPDKAHFSTEKY